MVMPARTLLGLAIDWLRWTQLVPMILAWAALLGAVIVFAFVNFQSQGLDVLEALQGWWARHDWLPRLELPEGRTGADGAWHVTGEDFRGPVLGLWGALSLAFWLLALGARLAFGAPPPWPLLRKLKAVAAAGAGAWTLLVAVYLASDQVFHGGPLQWLLIFAVCCLLPVLISLYALTVAHALGVLSDVVTGARPAP